MLTHRGVVFHVIVFLAICFSAKANYETKFVPSEPVSYSRSHVVYFKDAKALPLSSEIGEQIHAGSCFVSRLRGGSFGENAAGIGVAFEVKDDGKIFVKQILEGSAGDIGGLQIGDVLVAVDKWPVPLAEGNYETNFVHLSRRIKGPVGTPVELEILRKDGSTATLKLLRSKAGKPPPASEDDDEEEKPEPTEA